jgi:hypothetical protein
MCHHSNTGYSEILPEAFCERGILERDPAFQIRNPEGHVAEHR